MLRTAIKSELSNIGCMGRVLCVKTIPPTTKEHAGCRPTELPLTLRPRQYGRHFADDFFTCIFFNENCGILIEFSLKYVRRVQLTIIQHWFR